MNAPLYLIPLFIIFQTQSQAQVQNNGNIKMHNGAEMAIFGNFKNNGAFTNNQGTLHATGGNNQVFDGANHIHTTNFTINKSAGTLQLDNELQIEGMLTFTNGLIVSDQLDQATEFVHFLDESSYTGASNTSYIQGVARKTGDEVFIFPVGDNGLLRTVEISSPANTTDHFTTFYKEGDPGLTYNGNSLDAGIDHISTCEYWTVDRTGGSSDVKVRLSWAANSCGITDLCDLRVARWDGTKWTSEGNGGTTGNFTSGTLITGNACSTPTNVTNFSPFTLSSSTSNNPLPIGLIDFTATKKENNTVLLSWETATETNNAFFTIERSKSGVHWLKVAEVNGAGNSIEYLSYEVLDDTPYSGLSYYRLKQTDMDGKFSYHDIKSVNINQQCADQIKAYPNPTVDKITIEGCQMNLKYITIYNSMGQDVTHLTETIEEGKKNIKIDLSHLNSGIYIIKAGTTSEIISKQ